MNLTRKEWRIVFDLCNGKLPEEIATATGSSLKTIRNQIDKLHKKFNVNATHQIVSEIFRSKHSDHPALRFYEWIEGLRNA